MKKIENLPSSKKNNAFSIDGSGSGRRSLEPEGSPKGFSKSEFFENQLLDYKGASKYLSICESYLRRLKSKGKIPFVQIGVKGVRFRVASLNSWIAEREIK